MASSTLCQPTLLLHFVPHENNGLCVHDYLPCPKSLSSAHVGRALCVSWLQFSSPPLCAPLARVLGPINEQHVDLVERSALMTTRMFRPQARPQVNCACVWSGVAGGAREMPIVLIGGESLCVLILHVMKPWVRAVRGGDSTTLHPSFRSPYNSTNVCHHFSVMCAAARTNGARQPKAFYLQPPHAISSRHSNLPITDLFMTNQT